MSVLDPGGTSGTSPWTVWAVRAVTALALLVPVHLLVLIRRSSTFSAFDYFEMVPTILDADGSVVWSGLFVHQNDHLLAIPKLIYLVNIWLFAGSNITLGVFVWSTAAALALVLWVSLRPYARAQHWNVALVAWLFAVYLFPLAAQHNFRIAMSGTAWILANLLSVSAIALMVRERPLPAAAVGALATLTYGTGLAVWPALALVVVVRRRFGTHTLIAAAVGLASIAVQRITAEPGRSAFYSWSPIDIARSMAVTVGSLFSDDVEVAVLLGLAVFALAAVAFVRLGAGVVDDGPLLLSATVVFCSVGLAMFGISRSILGEDAFTASRYMAFAALFALSVSLLALASLGSSLVLRTVIVVLAAASVLAAAPRTVQFDTSAAISDDRMTAVFMGAGVGIVPLYTDATDAAFRAVGHVPFHGGFPFDCGRYGERVDATPLDDPGRQRAKLTVRGTPFVPSGLLEPVPVAQFRVDEISGWILTEGVVECLLVRDETSRVIGIGVVGAPAPPGDLPLGARPWRGYVERDATHGDIAVKLQGDDRLYVVGALPERDGSAAG